MSLDVSDGRISQQYHTILSTGSPIDWCSFGYVRSSVPTSGGKLCYLASGASGIDQLRDSMPPHEIQFGLIKHEGRVVLFTLIPESAAGVKRARALVHSRTLSNVLKSHHALFFATSTQDFTTSRIRSLLRLPPLSSTLQTPPRPTSTSSPSSASTLDQSISSTILAPTAAETRAQGQSPWGAHDLSDTASDGVVHASQDAKGKAKIPQQRNLPAFDLHHEYELPPQETGLDRRVVDSQPEGEDLPPRLPDKPPRTTSPTLSDRSDQRHQGLPPLAPPVSTDGRYNALLGPRAHEGLQPDGHEGTRATKADTVHLLRQSEGGGRRPVSESPAAVANLMFSRRSLDEEDGDRPDFSEAGSASRRTIDDLNASPLQEPSAPVSSGDTNLVAGEAGSLSGRRGAEADPQEEEADEDEEARFFDSYGDEVQDDHSQAADHQVESIGDGADEDDFDERERERAAAEENRLERQAEETAAQEEIRKREEELAREREAAEEREREREREAERVRQIEEQEELERAEQTRKAQEEMRMLIERDKLEKKLREEEEARQREVAKRQLFEQRKQDLADKRDAGQVMLQGEVSVQGGRSMLWRRRYYELNASEISFYKGQGDLAKPLDTVQMSTIASIVAHPDEPLPPHSFKALLKDGQDEWLFYGDDDEQKELLIEGLRIAAGL
ncbi:hypothetical protein JCM3766R1_004177 [Sporobolomyces carnicolor]